MTRSSLNLPLHRLLDGTATYLVSEIWFGSEVLPGIRLHLLSQY